MKPNSIYQFSANALMGGESVPLERYRDKLVLIVNTASQCGFTSQYGGLEGLYKKYQDHGLVILGFPCNQFGQQEPGDATEIAEFCKLNYGVSFPMFEKVDVNGPDAHPLFLFLQNALPGLLGKNIPWNFTKFLIGRDGTPLKRIAPTGGVKKMEALIRDNL